MLPLARQDMLDCACQTKPHYSQNVSPAVERFPKRCPNIALGLAVPPAEFVTELRSRQCMAEREAGAWCPECDGALDIRGHNSRMCCVGVARASENMLVVRGCPKFAHVRAPRLVECDDVPRCLVKFSE